MQEEPRNSSFSTPSRRAASITFVSISEVVVEELGRTACRWRGCRRPWRRRGTPPAGARSRHPALDLGLAAQVDARRGGRRRSRSPRAPAAARCAEPTMPRWPATQTRLPASRRGRAQSAVLPVARSGPGAGRPATISATSSLEAGRSASSRASRAPWSGSPSSSVDLGRAEIARVDLDQDACRCAASTPFSSTPSPCQSMRRCRSRRRRRSTNSRTVCCLAGGEHVVVGLRPAAASATCPRHSRAHGPSRAWRRGCRGRACPAARA